jgi:hypothetical protein
MGHPPRPMAKPDRVAGEFSGLSQVILSFGIHFALVPLVLSAAGQHIMGAFAIGRLSVLGWARSTRCQRRPHMRERRCGQRRRRWQPDLMTDRHAARGGVAGTPSVLAPRPGLMPPCQAASGEWDAYAGVGRQASAAPHKEGGQRVRDCQHPGMARSRRG